MSDHLYNKLLTEIDICSSIEELHRLAIRIDQYNSYTLDYRIGFSDSRRVRMIQLMKIRIFNKLVTLLQEK